MFPEIKHTSTTDRSDIDRIWEILEQVPDPEVPVLSVVDLGIIRDVRYVIPAFPSPPCVEVVITPTYSGCPAMDVISMQIKLALLQNDYKDHIITMQLSPAWTTDWMSKQGKDKLKAYGIAAPVGKSSDDAILENTIVPCPQCNSTNTELISQFGSTSCKALYKCNDCKEPFDHFKCH